MAVGEAPEVRAAEPVPCSRHTEGPATRYLCAAAHLRTPMLDASSLAQNRLRQVGRELLLGIPPGPDGLVQVGRAYVNQVVHTRKLVTLVPGVDADRVNANCRTARRQILVRDIALWVFTIISGLALVAAVAVAVFRYAPARAWRPLVPLGVAIVLVVLTVGQFGIWVLLAPPLGLIACWVAFFGDHWLARQHLRRLSGIRDSTTQPASHHHVDAGNVVPYARMRIVGGGIPQRPRKIMIAVDKPAPGVEPTHFKAHELLEHIASHARAQGLDFELTHGLPELDVTLVIAVSERIWTPEGRRVDRETIDDCADGEPSGATNRALVRVQAVTWEGQLVVSLYVSAALEGRFLTVRVLPHILLPVVSELRVVDRLGPRHALVHASHAGVDAVRELSLLAGRLRSAADRTNKSQPKLRQEHRQTHLASLRELYAEMKPDDIAQEEDALRIIEAIQIRVFDVTGEFLKDHGIDTQEFSVQVQNILQNSVVVFGDAGTIQHVSGNNAQGTINAQPQQGGPPL
jgi:hypothetical protein